MRIQILSLALVATIFALPVPASQLLATGPSAASAHSFAGPASEGDFATLIGNPFETDQLSFSAPASFLDTDTGVDPHET